jgi:hypothetical protein
MTSKAFTIRQGAPRWAAVCGFEGRYEVSDFGDVRSLPRKHCPQTRTLKGRPNDGGYLGVALYPGDGEKPKNLLVHRLVCAAFNGKAPDDLPDVNHKNGIKADNHYKNLEWSNDSLNVTHAIEFLGAKPPPGCKHWIGKFGGDHIASKPVVRISAAGETKRYPSAAATVDDGFSFRHVSSVCLGKRPRHRGFQWRFEEIK